jgi:hypothetical protein
MQIPRVADGEQHVLSRCANSCSPLIMSTTGPPPILVLIAPAMGIWG